MKKIGRRYKAQYEEVKGQLDQLQEAVAKEKAATPQPDPEMEAKINSLEDEVSRQKEVGLCVDIHPLIQGKKSEGWRRFQREKLACA